jgi:hypothetical protein
MPAQMVEREYGELFPGEVEAVHVVHDTATLNGLVKEYETLKGKLEDLLDDCTSKKRRHRKIKRKTVRARRGLLCGFWVALCVPVGHCWGLCVGGVWWLLLYLGATYSPCCCGMTMCICRPQLGSACGMCQACRHSCSQLHAACGLQSLERGSLSAYVHASFSGWAGEVQCLPS